MPEKPLSVYIGYDEHSQDAYDVCEYSLREHASIPIHTVRLEVEWLRRIGLYTRPWFDDGGQPRDSIDGRPFSTDFSFSRFLAPALQGEGWCVFVDQDFMFRDDVAKLRRCFDSRFAAMVIKHDFHPEESTKMRGQVQQPYHRKAWSSLVAWNCDHPAVKMLTPEFVNRSTGRWLHGFQWLVDSDIGALPSRWNWLDGHDSPEINPAAVHFTRGTPEMLGWERTQYAAEWRDSLARSRMPAVSEMYAV